MSTKVFKNLYDRFRHNGSDSIILIIVSKLGEIDWFSIDNGDIPSNLGLLICLLPSWIKWH
jgi:hypothetical protein